MPTEFSQTSRKDTHKKVAKIRLWRNRFSEVSFLSKKQTERLRRARNGGKRKKKIIHTNLLSFWKKLRYALKSCEDFTHFLIWKKLKLHVIQDKGRWRWKNIKDIKGKIICCYVQLRGKVFLYCATAITEMFPRSFQWDNKCHTLHASRKFRRKEFWNPVKGIMKLHPLKIYGKIFPVTQLMTAV